MTTSKEARIEISTKCNQSCTFCPQWRGDFTRDREFMSAGLFHHIISKLPKQIEVITLSGMGEMFMHPHVYEYIEYCKYLGYKVHALTNGSLIDDYHLSKIAKSKLDSLRVSFHSAGMFRHCSVTGTSLGGFQRVEYLLNNIKEIAPDMRVILSATQTTPDFEEINELLDKYKKKVDMIEVWLAHNWVDWKDYRRSYPELQTCGRPFNGPLQIQVDGTMNMCCFDFNGELEIGDLKELSVEEIYTGLRYKKICDYHTGNNDARLLCDNCDQRNAVNWDALLFSSEFSAKDRVGKTSTEYEGMK